MRQAGVLIRYGVGLAYGVGIGVLVSIKVYGSNLAEAAIAAQSVILVERLHIPVLETVRQAYADQAFASLKEGVRGRCGQIFFCTRSKESTVIGVKRWQRRRWEGVWKYPIDQGLTQRSRRGGARVSKFNHNLSAVSPINIAYKYPWPVLLKDGFISGADETFGGFPKPVGEYGYDKGRNQSEQGVVSIDSPNGAYGPSASDPYDDGGAAAIIVAFIGWPAICLGFYALIKGVGKYLFRDNKNCYSNNQKRRDPAP